MEFKKRRFLVPVSVACYNWKGDNGKSERKTVIVAPIRLVESDNGAVQVSWGCSRAFSCRDPHCRYSHVGRGRQNENS